MEGAVYSVYKDDVLFDEVVTDKDGIAYLNNIPLGKYKIKETYPSIGYNLDENSYDVKLSFENNEAIVYSHENIIKGDVELNKYYGYQNNYDIEDGAVFQIYDINDNLIGSYETVDGKVNEKLDYGDYYVIQTKGIYGYSFIDKFNISINENKKYSFNLYDNVLVVDVPNTGINKKYKLYPFLFFSFGMILIFKSLKKITVK